jgi:hypothetical protein
MKKDLKNGSIFVEGLFSLTILACTLSAIGILSFKIWSKSFINLESFYLGRARLYNNSKQCKNSSIVPQSLIERDYSCSE